MANSLRWLLAFALCCLTAAAAELLQPGDAVPEFPADAEWHAGGAQKIGDFGGKKALVLYFAKPGCPSCDDFAPHLYRLLLKNADALRVVMVAPGMYPSVDVANYAANRKLGDYPVMRDAGMQWAPRFIGKVDKFPYVAIVAADGKLAWYGRAKFHEQITAEVDRALGKAPQAPEAGLLQNLAGALVAGAARSSAAAAPLKSPVADCAAIAAALAKHQIPATLLAPAEPALTRAAFADAWAKFVAAPAPQAAPAPTATPAAQPAAPQAAAPAAAPASQVAAPAAASAPQVAAPAVAATPAPEAQPAPAAPAAAPTAKAAPEKPAAPRKLLFFYSGDAVALPLGPDKTDIGLRLADGVLPLTELAAKLPPQTELTVIIDSMHADRFAGMDAKAAEEYLFQDIVKSAGAALPGVSLMLSAARWDQSLLADETAGGTLFAKYLAEALAQENVPGPEALWRALRDRLADYGRQTGKLQSPAYARALRPE